MGTGTKPYRRYRARGGANGDGRDGAFQDRRLVGTYLHGPVLARNPALADALLERVVGPLEPLPNALVDDLREQRLAAAVARGNRAPSPRR